MRTIEELLPVVSRLHADGMTDGAHVALQSEKVVLIPAMFRRRHGYPTGVSLALGERSGKAHPHRRAVSCTRGDPVAA